MRSRQGAFLLAWLQFAQIFSIKNSLYINHLQRLDKAATGTVPRQGSIGAAVEFSARAGAGVADA